MAHAQPSPPLPTALDLGNIHAFPKLLAVGTDDRYDGHHSYEIVEALARHHASTEAVEAELAKLKASDKSYNGYKSDDIAAAIAKYAAAGHKELPQNFRSATNTVDSTVMAATSGAATGGTEASSQVSMAVGGGAAAAYSWTTTLHAMNWARVLYTIVWIVTGLTLLFFGYASLFWLHKLGLSTAGGRKHSVAAGLARASVLPGRSGKRRSNTPASAAAANKRTRPRAFLPGGVGGVLIGFLFCSYLAVIINNAVCVNDSTKKPLAAGAYFAVWLAPGLLGAVIGGHFAWVARAMAGVLGATALTVILTAVFGIRTMLIRVVLISILTAVMTLPLVQPRAKTIQMLLLNACTSLIGMVTFLNGVALVAPSVNASSNWLDLWTLLFMKDSSPSSRDVLLNAWSSSVFKGYIAGAVLGSVVGFAFELMLHRSSGLDPENEWNQYLGAYTHHIEAGDSGVPATYDPQDPTAAAALAGRTARASVLASAATARAGMFEPPASAWQRMVDFFDSEKSRPAHYGGLSGDGTDGHLKASPLSDKIRRKRSSRAGGNNDGGPARFSALPKGDFDDESSEESDDDDEFEEKHAGPSDEEATELGSDDDDDEKTKRSSIRKVPQTTMPMLTKDAPSATYNYGGYALPRPPMQHINGSGRSDAGTTDKSASQSRLTGTTLHGSSSSGSVGLSLHRPINVYRDSLTQPPSRPAQTTTATSAVPATPSLINAITRIEQAQQQARKWQQQHESRASPYRVSDDNAPSSPRKSAQNKSSR